MARGHEKPCDAKHDHLYGGGAQSDRRHNLQVSTIVLLLGELGDASDTAQYSFWVERFVYSTFGKLFRQASHSRNFSLHLSASLLKLTQKTMMLARRFSQPFRTLLATIRSTYSIAGN